MVDMVVEDWRTPQNQYSMKCLEREKNKAKKGNIKQYTFYRVLYINDTRNEKKKRDRAQMHVCICLSITIPRYICWKLFKLTFETFRSLPDLRPPPVLRSFIRFCIVAPAAPIAAFHAEYAFNDIENDVCGSHWRPRRRMSVCVCVGCRVSSDLNLL